MNPKFNKFILAALFLTLAACSSKNEDTTSTVNLIGSDLFSDRPQTHTWSGAIIRLKSPAVFSSAAYDGEISYEPKLLEAINKEQGEVIAKLRALSSEIRIVYRYRFVMNALSVAFPVELEDQVLALRGVSRVEKPAKFARPMALSKTVMKSFTGPSSVDFIGATKARTNLGLTGETIKVGVIDSGIDYTHAMFNGPGTPSSYENETGLEPNALFPNERVVGGIDLVGDDYLPGHLKPEYGLPHPDLNPLDRGGHGTHVAGTVAGIGDGVGTYDGVAPKAALYGIRVFGSGATGEDVVVAALEYAADPNGDGNPSDRLDVLNLSLGGDYGKPAIFYAEAMKNIANSGTLVAASAGNSGDIPFIVGSPSTSEGALSVAASIDNMDHNWKFKSSVIKAKEGERVVKRIEGSLSKPIDSFEELSGKLVYIGSAATPLSDEVKAKLKGKVALIDRGEVSFFEKLSRAADAGAIAAVVANNQPGEPIQMGGDESVDIGAIMVSLAVGDFVKAQMKLGPVTIDLKSDEVTLEPELIDTITGFSSRGPRSQDGVLKPEITAPGQQIISAAMGSGNEGVAFNGTSMSSPHMAGVFALMRERYPNLSTADIYNIIASTAKVMGNEQAVIDIARQGAGRVQVFEAASATVVISPALVSLGVQPLMKGKTLRREISVKNISDREQTFSIVAKTGAGIAVQSEQSEITLAAGETKAVSVLLTLAAMSDQSTLELEARLFFKSNEQTYHATIFGVGRLTGEVLPESLRTYAASAVEREGSLSELTMVNNGSSAAPVELFNYLGLDERKPTLGAEDLIRSRHCDLQAVGYRLVEADGETYIQFGLKIYQPVSRWQVCEASIQIDANGDGIAEQELGGISSENLYGLSDVIAPGQYSVLLDAVQTRAIRLNYERTVWDQTSPSRTSPNFVPAIADILEQKTYDFSTLTIVSARLSELAKNRTGGLNIKVAMLHENTDANSADDFLGIEGKWLDLSTSLSDQPFVNLPSSASIAAGESKVLRFEAGANAGRLMIVAPFNRTSNGQSVDLGLYLMNETLNP